MEDSLKKSLFVEFYGLPGSGKSTLSHLVAERLRREGHAVDEPSYETDHQHPLPKRVKKMAVGGYWFVFHHEQFSHIENIVRQNGYTGMEAFKQIVNVIQKMRIYNSPKAFEIVIIDQGLIQASISLSMYGAVKAKENYERLLLLMPNAVDALRVYIDVDSETALDRMRKRTTNDSRVEKLKEDSMMEKMLLRISEEIASVREECCGIGNEYVVASSDNMMKDADDAYNKVRHKLYF